MLSNISYPAHKTYSTFDEDSPLLFFLQHFKNSNKLQFHLGFYSSKVFSLLGKSLAIFISNGGNIELIINHVLTSSDKNMLLDVESSIDTFPEDFDKELIEFLNSDKTDIKHFFNCIAYLIRKGRIQIKIVKPLKGLAHSKEGLFSDGFTEVFFTGSANFTLSALTDNEEKIHVFDGTNKDNTAKIRRFKKDFEKIWSGDSENHRYLSPKETESVELNILNKTEYKEISELLTDELNDLREVINISSLSSRKVQEEIGKTQIHLSKILSKPHFPYPKGPRDYQKQAYINWKKNSYQGLFAMATGTGKTITSLNCILNEYFEKNYYRFLVLVPSIPLANQWKNEIENKFNFSSVIICNSRNPGWANDLRSSLKSINITAEGNVVIVATYSTFKTDRFRNTLFNGFGNLINTLTLIADEVHSMGSSRLLKTLPENIIKRIGLSATPERVYDQEGSLKLTKFFNSSPPTYTYQYNMYDAIDNGVLCPYFYYPTFFSLEDEELNQYLELTDQLRKHIDPQTGTYSKSKDAEKLLILRKNIIHKAKNKLSCLISIIEDIGPTEFKDAFIYVPEGFEPDYNRDDDFLLDTSDKRLLETYTKEIYDRFGLKLKSFTGETKGRDHILQMFEEGKYDALLAMKCLDEGIDVPRTRIAVFCSSTGNPRQFVQRRGRVLRTFKDKSHAIIYDLIASPVEDDARLNQSQRKAEINIFKSELRRVINFVALCDNRREIVKGSLNDLCEKLEIDLNQEILNELEKYNCHEKTDV